MIELRKALEADAFLLAETRRLVWQENFRGIYPDEKLDNYDVLAYGRRDALRIADPKQHYYLFMDGEKCVGYFSFGPYNYGSYKDFELCLNHLYLCNGYKGLGLGRKAFDILWQYCAEQKITKFFCGCNASDHAAMGFYRHMGGIQDESIPQTSDTVYFVFHSGD